MHSGDLLPSMAVGFDRRTFLRGGLAVTAGAALPLTMSQMFAPRKDAAAYGPLVEDPDGILDLPRGFSYRILERSGAEMEDGYRVPGKPDAMACFEDAEGRWVLMRNHELGVGDTASGPYHDGQSPPPEAYTPTAMGGVTRMVIDPAQVERIATNLVLAGTVRNCAGGPSPWGWLSCEETAEDGHGYVFIAPTDAGHVIEPRRVDAYGRFQHEAVAIDPRTHIAYLTEDRTDSAFYRFVPHEPDEPFEGRLEALRVTGKDRFDTGRSLSVGDRVEVDWVPIDDPIPSADTVRRQARQKGAAVVSRGEGLWWFEGSAYFTATSGGPTMGGQVFRYTPGAHEGTGAHEGRGVLELIAQSRDRRTLDMPDNLTVAPGGDVFLAEDGRRDNYVRILQQDGRVSDFARNASSGSELAGVCFSPDARTLFANIQHDGLTVAVTGPFDARNPAPKQASGTGGSVASDEDSDTI